MISLMMVFMLMAGDGYRDAVLAVMASGEGYEDGQEAAENADIFLPPGEHPLDDENLDVCFKGDVVDKYILHGMHRIGLWSDLHLLPNNVLSHGSNACWSCSNCGQNNYAHNSTCSNCGASK